MPLQRGGAAGAIGYASSIINRTPVPIN
jgi:hypothetical protein